MQLNDEEKNNMSVHKIITKINFVAFNIIHNIKKNNNDEQEDITSLEDEDGKNKIKKEVIKMSKDFTNGEKRIRLRKWEIKYSIPVKQVK